MPDSKDLARMRATVESKLPTTATIARKTVAERKRGVEFATYVTVATVAARVSRSTAPVDVEEGGQIRTPTLYLITLPYGTDVADTDQITVDGTTYTVADSAISNAWDLAKYVKARPL